MYKMKNVSTGQTYLCTDNPCAKSMVRSPYDPAVCYSMTRNNLEHKYARVECGLQGGKMMELASPAVEETVYKQLLLKEYRFVMFQKEFNKCP